MCTASFLSLALRKMRQPKVIAEVLGGILLGAFNPMDLCFYSADKYMQKVQPRLVASPDSQKHIFPLESRPYLGLVANIGLCLFLFLVGLEIDAASYYT